MEYEKFLKQNKEEMISALQEVVRINSEEGESFVCQDETVYPFGQGIQNAFEATLDIGQAPWIPGEECGQLRRAHRFPGYRR